MRKGEMQTSSRGRHYRERNMPAPIAISDYKICKPGTMHALAYSYETGVPKTADSAGKKYTHEKREER